MREDPETVPCHGVHPGTADAIRVDIIVPNE